MLAERMRALVAERLGGAARVTRQGATFWSSRRSPETVEW